MKAWLVRKRGEFFATIVFAETRGKAKSNALYTECCEDADFCNIEVHREPKMDGYYTDGKLEMDWYDFYDRIALVKECGFTCDRDCFYTEDCKSCDAREYCDNYHEYIEQMESDIE